MAPYNPPIAHYTEMDVSQYDEDTIYNFMGKNGKRFYWLTSFLQLNYLWFDEARKVIEIWGPYHALEFSQPHHVIGCELEHFCSLKT